MFPTDLNWDKAAAYVQERRAKPIHEGTPGNHQESLGTVPKQSPASGAASLSVAHSASTEDSEHLRRAAAIVRRLAYLEWDDIRVPRFGSRECFFCGAELPVYGAEHHPQCLYRMAQELMPPPDALGRAGGAE
jgi:hypothetical protein